MRATRDQRRRGFTAAELSAVAAIIAILSLIIVPIFRDRVDNARRVATLDDLQALAKAEMLVQADTGRFVRLNDLDNSTLISNPPLSDEEVPLGSTRGIFPDFASRNTFAQLWKGPYAAFQNHTTVGVLVAQLNPIISSQGGPALVFDAAGLNPTGVSPGLADRDWEEDRYPIDHYGLPYVFLTSIDHEPPDGTVFPAQETQWGTQIIYSFGPDGLPGAGAAVFGGTRSTNALWREFGAVGTGDDLSYTF